MFQRNRRRRKIYFDTAQYLLILLWVVYSGRQARSEDPPQDPLDEKRQTVKEAQTYLKQLVVRDRGDTRYEPLDKPLLSSSDLARGELGWTWAFGKTGRPVFMMELYKYTRRQRWELALTLTSDVLIEARLPNGRTWSPRTTQLQLRELPDAPPPADRSIVRKRQAKLLARRFDAHEFWGRNNDRFELRLLQTPLHTYTDEVRTLSGSFARRRCSSVKGPSRL